MNIGRCLFCRRPDMELEKTEVPDVSTANRMVLLDLCADCRSELPHRKNEAAE